VFGSSQVRIGLSDELNEGVFLWDSGEPLAYTNWRPDEPNNNLFPFGEENSVEMNVFYGSQWNDVGTPALRNSLIEVAEVVPEPSSLGLATLGLACLVAWKRGRVRRRRPAAHGSCVSAMAKGHF
jgi:hypothetical protein